MVGAYQRGPERRRRWRRFYGFDSDDGGGSGDAADLERLAAHARACEELAWEYARDGYHGASANLTVAAAALWTEHDRLREWTAARATAGAWRARSGRVAAGRRPGSAVAGLARSAVDVVRAAAAGGPVFLTA